MLALATAFAAVFLLLPFAAIRQRWARLPRKAPAALYFAALGLGFMFFEICLIQKLTLFLGYPTYTLTVTLFALLVFSGLGSYATEWYVEARDRMLPALLGALLLLTLFYQFGLDVLMNALVGWGLAARIATTVLVLAPLGLCLGAFMPLGLGTRGAAQRAAGRVHRLVLGDQRRVLRDRLDPRHDRLDVLRVPRAAAAGPGPLRRRRSRAARDPAGRAVGPPAAGRAEPA